MLLIMQWKSSSCRCNAVDDTVPSLLVAHQLGHSAPLEWAAIRACNTCVAGMVKQDTVNGQKDAETEAETSTELAPPLST